MYHCLRVHPELEDGVQREVPQHVRRGQASRGQWEVEHPREQRLYGPLPQRSGQVVSLAAMVDAVREPQAVQLVSHAVEPIVGEVAAQEPQQEQLPGRGYRGGGAEYGSAEGRRDLVDMLVGQVEPLLEPEHRKLLHDAETHLAASRKIRLIISSFRSLRLRKEGNSVCMYVCMYAYYI